MSVVDVIDKIGGPLQKFMLNSNNEKVMNVLLICSSYLFPIYFMYVLIFLTAASDRYGQRPLELGLRRKAGNNLDNKRGYVEVLVLNSRLAT